MNEKEALKLCLCKGCPSFVPCDEKIAYCYTGKSICIKEEKGCLCPPCPVEKKAGFTKTYYCTRGKAK